MIQFLHQLSLGTRGFFLACDKDPETALEKPLAPRVSSALFEIKTG